MFFKIAAGFYVLCWVAAFFRTSRNHLFVRNFLTTGLCANAVAVALRYHQAWPMLPMYLSPLALPLCLSAFLMFFELRPIPDIKANDATAHDRDILWTAGLIVCLALSTVFFPKDFYLPFLKSKSLFAHAFVLLSVLGKGCFLMGAVKAAVVLTLRHGLPGKQIMAWVVWGFAFWTLSMFSGELWSYLGWGTPVVWEDAAITGVMAVWFYYIALLHLHLTGKWRPTARHAFTAAGAVAVVLLTCVPDLGPLRVPW